MSLLGSIFGEKKTITKPTFIKDFNEDNLQLKDLEKLTTELINGHKKELIERDIMFLRQGISGEKNVYFELRNSFFPMLCLHDIRIEFEDYIAQLDFVVITNKFLCILETKKLNGNIVINRDGDFIRLIKNKYGKEEKEGIYSPVSQNIRHINIVKELLKKKLDINHMPLKSLIVMANPKTVVDKEKCPKDIKFSIYKYDQIIKQLEKYQEDKNNDYNLDEKNLYGIANLLINMNKPIDFNYKEKYALTDDDFIKKDSITTNIVSEEKATYSKPQQEPKQHTSNNKEKTKEQVAEELKKFRLETSKRENIPAYYVFNNAEMDELIEKWPITKEELINVKGFGAKKIEQYGEEILKILK